MARVAPETPASAPSSNYLGRDHQELPWVAENGLRVDGRTSQTVQLVWGLDDDTKGQDGLNGPWYEVQMKKGQTKWETIYRGYRTRTSVKELVPDAVLHFRMRRNGQKGWGTTITAATDSSPPLADDIHRAVACNAEKMVLRIIGGCKGVRLRKLLLSHDAGGMNPLMVAAQNGNANMCALLLRAGALADAPSFTSRKTALMYACMNGNVRVLEILDEAGVDWDYADNAGCTAFHHAVNSNKLDALKYAVTRCGPKILEGRDSLGWTPLLRSVAVGSTLEVVKFLLLKGSNPNAADKAGTKSCLIAAVLKAKNDIVELLLLAGADPTFRNSNKQTAYDIATSLRYQDIANMIVHFLTKLASRSDKHRSTTSTRNKSGKYRVASSTAAPSKSYKASTSSPAYNPRSRYQ